MDFEEDLSIFGACASNNLSEDPAPAATNWDTEVESVIQELWGNKEKTNRLKSIWTSDGDNVTPVAACKNDNKGSRPSTSDRKQFVFSSEAFTPYIHYQAVSPDCTSLNNTPFDLEKSASSNDAGFNMDALFDVQDLSTCNNFQLDAEICAALDTFCLDSERCHSSNNFRPDFEKSASSNNNNNNFYQGNCAPCNTFYDHSRDYYSRNKFPDNPQMSPVNNSSMGNPTPSCFERNLIFENSPPNISESPVVLSPVAPEFAGNIVRLSKCFTTLVSHDLDIKACDKLMGISSLNHPVEMPESYTLEELEKLVIYSEKQIEFFAKFITLVEERFKNEEKQSEIHNKYLRMWNELRGDRWDEGSFEDAIFSTSDRIKNGWSKTNKFLRVLLNENGPHQVTNLQLFPAYFEDLEKVVLNARTAIWAITEKIKMTKDIPDPKMDSDLLPIGSTYVPAGVDPGSSKKNDSNYRQYRSRRRGKNFKKF